MKRSGLGHYPSRLALLLVCLLHAACGQRHGDVEADYLANLQARRKQSDMHRIVLVARCGQIIDVWQAAIDGGQTTGEVVAQYSAALARAKSSEHFRAERKMLTGLIRGLANPPPRYRSQYEKLLRQYGYVSRLQNLVEKPTGSLASYVAEVRTLAGEYDQLKAELDASLDEPTRPDPVLEPSP